MLKKRAMTAGSPAYAVDDDNNDGADGADEEERMDGEEFDELVERFREAMTLAGPWRPAARNSACRQRWGVDERILASVRPTPRAEHPDQYDVRINLDGGATFTASAVTGDAEFYQDLCDAVLKSAGFRLVDAELGQAEERGS